MHFFKTGALLLLVSSALLFVPAGCNPSGGPDPVTPVTNTLVSSTLIGQFTTDQLRSRFTGSNVGFQLFIRYPISVYRVTYTTTNTDGKSITASGALMIPTVNSTTGIPMLSIQHGTITSDDGAPSNYQSGSEAYTFGSVFASQGYIIAAPDYIGYGASKDLPHTYEHRNGLATASLDMLRAARQVLTDKSVNWDKRLLIAGYSEGGYATLALQKKIEEETGSEFNLVASSCGAGAYDKPAFMKQILNNTTSTDPSISRLYLWVLLTYDRIYNLNRPASYYFKEPYATRIAASGYTANLGGLSFNQVVTDSFKQAINNGTDTDFIKAAQDNDIHDWKPRTNTRLYHGDADDTVLFLNSQNAYDAMRARGATNVQLIRLSGANHATGILGYITGTYDFFSSLQ
ncbi:alpha/beta hydrolase family protein [Spirosoma rhododendri]|uniref:Prolyl oligopeptidase family serine peptidase n=1 Tax=Spirosoma rhododendri TaxID=2728024 RepID=A0A7L5DQW9_9BACT|nr:lipase family protein [Spirosoma rhododendri]QJD80874.1 prolyl oligopeptidase family serine peptidase [Spirosoma rhododendri]